MAVCHRCGASVPGDTPVSRSAECESCSAPIRACLNCHFYEPGAHWDCRETIAEPVHDKERANFCDYFKLNRRSAGSGTAQHRRKDARDDFNALFS